MKGNYRWIIVIWFIAGTLMSGIALGLGHGIVPDWQALVYGYVVCPLGFSCVVLVAWIITYKLDF